MTDERHTRDSPWYQRGKKAGLRSRPKFWRELKALGRCPSCWKTRDREGTLCVRCCERARLQARRKAGWDGKTPWQPKNQGRAPRRYVGCSLPLADYERLLRVVGDEGSTLGAIVREAVQTYLGEIFET